MQLLLLLPHLLWLFPWMWTSLWTPIPSKVPHHLAATMVPLMPLHQPAPQPLPPSPKHSCKPPWPKAPLQPHQPNALPQPLLSHLVLLLPWLLLMLGLLLALHPCLLLLPLPQHHPQQKPNLHKHKPSPPLRKATTKKSPPTSQPKPVANPVATSQPPQPPLPTLPLRIQSPRPARSITTYSLSRCMEQPGSNGYPVPLPCQVPHNYLPCG